MLNGQDVVIFAPRRYGKSSLAWRVAQDLVRRKVLVAQVDLMTTPTKEKLAEKLAKAIHENVASALFRARERLQVFRGLAGRPDDQHRSGGRLGQLQLRGGAQPRGRGRHARAPPAAAAQLASERDRRWRWCWTSSRRSWRSTPTCRS